MAKLSIRIDLGGQARIGPGKITLLEQIRATGSISGAGRALGMSYRRAWLLVEDLNTRFKEPAVAAQAGGSRGGGAVLTPFGQRLVDTYRALEQDAHEAASARLAALEASLLPQASGPAA